MTIGGNKYCINAKRKFETLLNQYTSSYSSIVAPKATQDYLLRTNPALSPSLQMFSSNVRNVNVQLLYPPESDCWGQQWQLETSAFQIIASQTDTENNTSITIIVGLNDEDFRIAARATIDWLIKEYSFHRLKEKYLRHFT